MDPKCVIVPSPLSDWSELKDDSTAVALARTVQGKVYRKHILSRGKLFHPVTGTEISVDDKFISALKRNFDNNVCDIVQVPLANDKNEHVESPAANLGEVVGIEDDPESGKIYALVDARADAEKFGKTYLGSSAFFHLNYKDSKTNTRVGPTLLHVAVTNRPYVTGLDPYEPVVAASAEDIGQPAVVRMSGANDEEGSMPRSLDEIVSELLTDHNIDFNDLKTKLTAAEDKNTEIETKLTAAEERATKAEGEKSDETQLVTKIVSALKGTEQETKLSGENVSDDDLVKAVTALADRNVALASEQETAVTRIASLEKKNAEGEIDRLIDEGRILPKKRDVFLTMALTNRELFDQVLPEEPIVKLNAEKLTGADLREHGSREIDVDKELERLTATGGAAAQYIK